MSTMSHAAPRRSVSRRRITVVAALAVVLMAAAAMVAHQPVARAADGVIPAVNPATPAAANAAAAPVANPAAHHPRKPSNGKPTLTVSPTSGLAPSDAQITVDGTGFNDHEALVVAICEDDGAAPRSLNHCLGGRIPNQNQTSSWGIVSASGRSPYPGPATAKWSHDGSFSIKLHILAAAGQDADCLSNSCSVYTRSAEGTDPSQSTRVPLSFNKPRTTTSRPPTTQTFGTAPTSVTPESVAETSIAAGEKQSVTFAGFKPGETVDVTLYSKTISLPAVKADGDGVVTISFTVPDDLPPGVHLVEAVGTKSGVTGLAQFVVGAAESSTTETTATTDATETAGSAAGSDVPGMTGSGALPAPDDSAELSPESTAGFSGLASSGALAGSPASSQVDPSGTQESGEAAGNEESMTAAGQAAGQEADPADSGSTMNRLAWLLIALVVLVVLAGIAVIVVTTRRRRL